MKTKISVIALLSIFFILALSGSMKNSATCDEVAHHIPTGYALLSKWDFKIDTCSPPLPRYIVGLPLKLFMKINMPDNKDERRRPDRASFGRDFFYKYNNQAKEMLLAARVPVILIGILCGLLLFIWTASLYGEKAGLFSLFIYVFSPDILAHSGLATADMIATFFIFLASYSFWLFLRDSSVKNMLLAGFCLGLAELSKYSSILLYPIFLLLIFFGTNSGIKKPNVKLITKFFMIIFISLLITWAGYGFDIQPILKDSMRVEEKLEFAHNTASKILPFFKGLTYQKLDDFLLNFPFPLGAHTLGLMGVFRHGYEGHGTFFWGKWSSHGTHLYFLAAFLIKTPIPLLLFLIAGLYLCIKNKIKKDEKFVLILAASFFIASSFSGLQLGIRYILPIYPLCFIIAGRSVEFARKKLLNFVLLFLMTWYVISALWIQPHYLSYFNEAVGGPKDGYKYLRDSNIDWGQDLPALAEYMNKNGVDKIVLEYFGEGDPSLYGIHYRKLNSIELDKPENDVYAISVQYLEHVNWSKDYKPTAYAGYSIFIYDFTEKGAK